MIKIKENRLKIRDFHFCGLFSYFLLLPFAHYLLPITFLLFTSKTNAQQIQNKPKIGLVLSGGGAKGLAHIGVLKVIDSLGIKIDYIGGTSMGGIVGGLYAAGYSGNQLENIFSQLNTDDIIQDNIPRTVKSFFEKANSDKYAISLPFRNFKVETPNGLSKGIYNFNFFTQLTQNVRHINDFSKLPIPFFCIATNIVTGEEKILDSGNLAQAMAASGAIPSLYNPVNIDGELYVDGGITNNYPIEELLKKNVDIVIGVNVQDDLKSKEELQGVTKILQQISSINVQKKMESKIGLTHIYLKPNIKGFNMFSFENGKQIIQNGKTEALLFINELKKFENTNKANQNTQIIKDSLAIKNIDINDLNKFTRAYVLGKLNLKSNNNITYKKLYNGVQTLNATQNFNTILYNINNQNDIIFNLQENPINSYIKLGVHYDGLYKSAALVNYTQKKIISKNDVFSLDLGIGDNFRYDLNYLIDNGFYWSFGLNSNYLLFNKNISSEIINQPIINNLSTININYNSYSTQAFTQTVFLRKYLIGGGADYQFLKITSDNLPLGIRILEQSNYLSVFAYLKHDTFDNKFFPNKGWIFNANFKNYLYSSNFNNKFEPFSINNLEAAIAVSPLKKWSITVNADAGFKIGSSTTPFYNFVLGGYGFRKTDNLKPFFGYDFLSQIGDSYWKTSITIDYEIYKKNHINFTTNNAVIGDFIYNSTKDWINKPDLTGFALGYGIDTLIGPLEIKYSWSDQVKQNFVWFNIGFSF